MNLSDAYADRQRRLNRMKMVQAELARQREEEAFNAMRLRKQKAAAVDEALAQELSEQQRHEIKDEKMLQLVMDFPEMRNFKKTLMDAHANKERVEFKSNKPEIKAQEAREHQEYIQACVERDRIEDEKEEQRRKQELERFQKHQESQLALIREKRERTLASLEDKKKERIAVDAVAARLQEKDMLDALGRREAQRKHDEERAEFYRLRGLLKQAEKEREAKEEAAIQAYLAEQDRRREVEKKLDREKDIVKTRILEEQCRKISEEQQKKLELESLLQEYYEEERIAKERALIKAEKESHERMAAAVAKENLELIENRRKQREIELEQEMKCRQLAMEDLAAAARAEQARKQQAILDRQEEIAEGQRFMEQRRLLKEREKEIERQVEAKDMARELELQEYIRRARAMLLEEHMPKLGNYAPTTNLRPDERERYLPQIQAAQAFQQKQRQQLLARNDTRRLELGRLWLCAKVDLRQLVFKCKKKGCKLKKESGDGKLNPLRLHSFLFFRSGNVWTIEGSERALETNKDEHNTEKKYQWLLPSCDVGKQCLPMDLDIYFTCLRLVYFSSHPSLPFLCSRLGGFKASLLLIIIIFFFTPTAFLTDTQVRSRLHKYFCTGGEMRCSLALWKKQQERVWRAVPLPQAFHTALESGDWVKALQLYEKHPYHTPPIDTFDLLRSIMHATGVGVADVKRRFNEKIRLSEALQHKTSEEVDASGQIAMAEACAVLLKGAGDDWEERLIESVPFGTTTRSNLVQVALKEGRWDVAIEMLRTVLLPKSEMKTIWPVMAQFSWEKVLGMISACPKYAVPYESALPHILNSGCSLQRLSEHLEQAGVLGDVEVVTPLLAYAESCKDWDYVNRCIDHLQEIGHLAPAVVRTYHQLTRLHSTAKVCKALRAHRVRLSEMTIENLEALKL
eukprot:gene6065-4364_t